MRIEQLEAIAEEAGNAVLPLYRSGHIDVITKADASPVTKADLLANEIICRGIRQFSNLPIISEEGSGDDVDPKDHPSSFWLIDPIDGTKEFIAHRPTFTVNIALIEHGVPIAGVVHAPDRGELYSGSSQGFRLNGALQSPQWAAEPTVVASATHTEKEFEAFLSKNQLLKVLRIGSSIKFCLVAKGDAHYYPRYNSLSAWDIAAGHAVARAAGCHMLDMKSGKPVLYDFRQRWVPGFVLHAPGLTAIV